MKFVQTYVGGRVELTVNQLEWLIERCFWDTVSAEMAISGAHLRSIKCDYHFGPYVFYTADTVKKAERVARKIKKLVAPSNARPFAEP